MDHLVSLLDRITALLEEFQREWGVTLRPDRLGTLPRLVAAFCNLVAISLRNTDLPPSPTNGSLGRVQLEKWEKLGQGEGPNSETSREEIEEDTLSIPDSLPNLIDEGEGEELPSLVGLVEKGIVPQGLALCQGRTRVNRFWLF